MTTEKIREILFDISTKISSFHNFTDGTSSSFTFGKVNVIVDEGDCSMIVESNGNGMLIWFDDLTQISYSERLCSITFYMSGCNSIWFSL